MEAKQQDILSSAIMHLNLALIQLDEIGGLQNLFKQDYKQLVKRTIIETESRLNKINNALDDEEKTAYYDMFEQKMSLYQTIDSLDTETQIKLFTNFCKMKENLI